MPRRNEKFVTDQIYHVFNRGVARMSIYSSSSDFKRFLDLAEYYLHADTPVSFSHFKKLALEKRDEIFYTLKRENKLNVEVLAFCLMDNHYHYLLKQAGENGIKIFMSNLQNGYAKYYNVKHKRTGPLLQPMFKAVRIETDEQLIHVSRYIHLNPSTDYKVTIEELADYPWSSFATYISKKPNTYSFIKTDNILGFFKNNAEYREFVFDQAEYQRELSKIKHLTF